MKLLNTLIWLCAASLSWSQTASIRGQVTEYGTEDPLPGVSIYLEGTQIGAISNTNGYYHIEGIPVGKYTLVASAIGYYVISKEVELAADQQLEVNFNMIESITTLAEVTVMTSGRSSLKDIPGSVSYLSPKALNKFSYTDINRTLRMVPGINLQEEDGFGLRPNIGLRGTSLERSSKITLMEDGVLMAPAPYTAPAAYYFPTVGRMQGVEVLKGSSQIKYGPYTTGGAINFISTQIPESFLARVYLTRGSYGTNNLHAYVGNTHKQVAYLLETFQYASDGFKVLDNSGPTGFDRKDYMAKVRYQTKDDARIFQSLTLKLGEVREISDETYLGLTDSDFALTPYRRYAASQKDRLTLSHRQIALIHLIRPSEQLEITTTAYRTDLFRNWYKLYKVTDDAGNEVSISDLLATPETYPEAYQILTGATSMRPDALWVKANNRTYFARGIQSNLSAQFTTGKVVHHFDLGLRLHQDQMDRFQWVDSYAMEEGVMKLTQAGQPGTESNRIEQATAFASYIQHRMDFGKWQLVPGLRYEHIQLSRMDYGKNDPTRTGINLNTRSNFVRALMPGLGLTYHLQQQIYLFAGIHKGFAPPGSKEGTRPEESVNYELGTRLRKKGLSSEAVVFVTDYDNLLGSDLAAAGGTGGTDLYNAGEVLTRGLELQLSYDFFSPNSMAAYRLPFTLIYTYTHSEFRNSFESDNDTWGIVSSGDEFPYLAHHQLTLLLALEHHKFDANISYRYTGPMRTTPGQGSTPESEKIDAYFVVDASINYLVHPYVKLFASCVNLTDEVYLVARRPAGLRPGLPRTLQVGIKANFLP